MGRLALTRRGGNACNLFIMCLTFFLASFTSWAKFFIFQFRRLLIKQAMIYLMIIFLSYLCKFLLFASTVKMTVSPRGFRIIPNAAVHASWYNHFPSFCSASCPSVVMK